MKKIRIVALLIALIAALAALGGCSTSAGSASSVQLTGQYVADNSGVDLDRVIFSGKNGIELRYGSWMDTPEKGTYTIVDGKLTATVTYSDGNGGTQTDTNTFTFEQSGNTITLDGQTYTKQ